MNDRFLFEACLRFRNQPDMAPVKEYLEMQLDGYKQSLVTLTDHQSLLRTQGKAQAIKEFLELVERSPALLDQKR